MRYNKLVRDKIPDIIKGSGKRIRVRRLHDQDFLNKLNRKLREEVDEYKNAITDENRIEELADILEVIYHIAKVKGVSRSELEEIRRNKNEVKGSFNDKWYLLWVSDEDE